MTWCLLAGFVPPSWFSVKTSLIPANVAENLRRLRKVEIPSGPANAATVSARKKLASLRQVVKLYLQIKWLFSCFYPHIYTRGLFLCLQPHFSRKNKNLGGSQKMFPPKVQVTFWSTFLVSILLEFLVHSASAYFRIAALGRTSPGPWWLWENYV